MWKIKRIFLSAALLCLLLLPVAGFCSGTYQMTEEQLTTLESNLTTLQQDNASLSNMQIQSTEDLQKAQQLLMKSDNLIQMLQTQLTQLQTETAVLKQSLNETDKSLAKANQYLSQCENQLKSEKRQNTWLKYALIGVGAYALSRR